MTKTETRAVDGLVFTMGKSGKIGMCRRNVVFRISKDEEVTSISLNDEQSDIMIQIDLGDVADLLPQKDSAEPVGPTTDKIRQFRCGACGEIIGRAQKYCGYCGRRMKWDPVK